MKKFLLVATLFSIIFLAILCKPSEEPISQKMPPPTETIVKMDAEDVPKKKVRKAWFDLMHQAEPGTNWRDIEFENNQKSARYKRALRKDLGDRDPLDGEIVASGNIEGKWIERGSNNNAGSMMTVNYFKEEDLLFGRSAGGTLWKGDRSGFNWEVVNQDYRFSGDLVEMRYLPNGEIRYIANLRNEPVYSDDGGETWIESEGVPAAGGARMYDFVEKDNGKIFVLQQSSSSAGIRAYMSNDNATSFERVAAFNSNNWRDFNLVTVGNTDEVYLIEQVDADETRLHRWNEESSEFDILQWSSPIGFGTGNERANLNAVYDGDSLRLFVLAAQNEFFTSIDTGKTWKYLSTLPTNPWDVGVFVSPSDYTKIHYGEVNPYRSPNGGKSWNKVSNWWEYYGDIYTKLHADIMDIKEFVDQDGQPFLVNCNHGGLSESYDNGATYQNIGLLTLNISQYYSVATHPSDTEWVFAGAQDQGFQRGRISAGSEMDADFLQVISGDYGHIVFSGEDDNMWTVYPGGAVSYYNNPITQGPTSGYTVESDNETVWIPPLLAHPDKSQNTIFLAGGNANGGTGSHMIKLEANDANEISVSQFDFDFLNVGNGAVSAMGISPINHNLIFVATTGGRIFKSDDGGQTFANKQNGMPTDHYLYGSCIKPSLIDENVVYMSGSGYSNPGVFKSTDAGESYQRMDNGIPNTMIFCLAPNEDESLIFAATEAGPYVYIAALDEWFELSGAGTPNQTYWSVEYLPGTKTARFGTYGRGIWDFNVEKVIISDVEEELTGVSLKIFPNPFQDKITVQTELNDAGSILITDQKGQTAFKKSYESIKNNSVDLSNYPSGIYFVTINVNNKVKTTRIVKQ